MVWLMMKGKKEAVLLERAGIEEKGYNWVEAARLYEEAAKSFWDKEMVEKAAGIYKKLGYVCARAAGTAETAEDHLELNKREVEAYKKTGNIRKQARGIGMRGRSALCQRTPRDFCYGREEGVQQVL